MCASYGSSLAEALARAKKLGPVSCVTAQLNHSARRISLRSANAFLNSTLT